MASTLEFAIESEGIVLRESVVVTVIDDGAVLFDLESKYFFRLNQPAWAIVQLFECDPVTFGAIEEAAQRWGAAPGDSTIRSLIAELKEHDLIVCAPASELQSNVQFAGPWSEPRMECQKEPLQKIVTNAFDPSVPLAE
jgi:hypothetical protein